MKIDLNAMGYDELLAHGDAVMEAIKKRTFQEGFQAAKQVQRKLAKMKTSINTQARRDEIVEQAKADVEELSNYGNGVWHETDVFMKATCKVEFVVNRDKRTVVALLRGVRTRNVYARGIAKAAPSDCFNVHIGKAIALRRALGLAVPDEYLNAPQPTEVRVGDVVEGHAVKDTALVISDDAWPPISGAWVPLKYARQYEFRIIDDSREEVGE
ncbi:hypothetical protein [Bacillus subtilis]|uniref:hypothetical protein n=1 Tax=Bacillus subtilis TaxID=1423 RepID=UPI00100A0D5A|nr:hypothetical protein [Bacillus subtilis]QAW54958.1 hypothetical protein ETL60_14670 [Bacillus subtilis]